MYSLSDPGIPERTKERPLARGDITPTQAFAFLGLQLSAGLAVLTQLNWYRYGRDRTIQYDNGPC